MPTSRASRHGDWQPPEAAARRCAAVSMALRRIYHSHFSFACARLLGSRPRRRRVIDHGAAPFLVASAAFRPARPAAFWLAAHAGADASGASIDRPRAGDSFRGRREDIFRGATRRATRPMMGAMASMAAPTCAGLSAPRASAEHFHISVCTISSRGRYFPIARLELHLYDCFTLAKYHIFQEAPILLRYRAPAAASHLFLLINNIIRHIVGAGYRSPPSMGPMPIA